MKVKIHILLFLIIFAIPNLSIAWNPLETVEEAKERKAADRYYQRQENPYNQKPLGGYSDRNDPSYSSRESSSYESSSSRIPQYHSPLETIDEQKTRHRTEQYEERRKSPYGEPLGGYPEKLGDTEPYQKKKSSYYGKDKHYYGDEEEE